MAVHLRQGDVALGVDLQPVPSVPRQVVFIVARAGERDRAGASAGVDIDAVLLVLPRLEEGDGYRAIRVRTLRPTVGIVREDVPFRPGILHSPAANLLDGDRAFGIDEPP